MNTTALKISQITMSYWTKDDFEQLHAARSVKEMLPIAIRILKRMPQGRIYQVCGPIGSGGFIPLLGKEDGVIANLNSFNNTIKYLQTQGLNVFDQMPFEHPMQKLKKEGQYPEEILTDFYWPIFESKMIHGLKFMPNWKSSIGAEKEMNKSIELAQRVHNPVIMDIETLEIEL